MKYFLLDKIADYTLCFKQDMSKTPEALAVPRFVIRGNNEKKAGEHWLHNSL